MNGVTLVLFVVVLPGTLDVLIMNGVTLVLFVVVLPGTLDVLIMNGVTLVCRGRTAGFL